MATQSRLNIPVVYRILFLYVEPFLAFAGSIMLHFTPSEFLSKIAPNAKYAPDNQVVYDQVAAFYILTVFNLAVILRITNDIRMWRAILMGVLLCDTLHLSANWRALGSAIFWDPRTWSGDDWGNLGFLWGHALARVAFLAGFGIELGGAAKKSD
ncbi:hypothetical protein EDB80DRAFT_728680 [Ilyonectria destructans]|nr:hypothetical protein EDB80DRAFT_728680 [Ilyonectria destructans]